MMALKYLDFRTALADPRAEFGSPERLLSDPRLDREGKRAILRGWVQDERELAVAEEEGMAGGETSMLHRVVKALDAISGGLEKGAETTVRHGSRAPGTKTTDDGGHTAWLVRDLMRPVDEIVHIDQDLIDAKIRMRHFQTSFLPVVDGDEIVGILTARDIYSDPPPAASNAPTAKVRDRLSSDIAYCYESDDLETAKAVAQESGQRRILVTDKDYQLVGLITLERITAALRDRGSRHAPAASREPGKRLIRTAGRTKGARAGTIGVYAVRPKIKK